MVSYRRALPSTENKGGPPAPWGEGLSGFTASSHLFAGYEWDLPTGNNYVRARYYGARFASFLTPDPAGTSATCLLNPQTQNRYAYVTDNPLNETDPTGLCGDGDNSDCGGIGISIPFFPGGGGAPPAPPTPHPVFSFGAQTPAIIRAMTQADCDAQYADCMSKVNKTISDFEKAHNKEYKECLQDCAAGAVIPKWAPGAVGGCAAYCSIKYGVERLGDLWARDYFRNYCKLEQLACYRRVNSGKIGSNFLGGE